MHGIKFMHACMHAYMHPPVSMCHRRRETVPGVAGAGAQRLVDGLLAVRSLGLKAGIRWLHNPGHIRSIGLVHAIAQLPIFQEGFQLGPPGPRTGKACPRVLPLQNLCRGPRVCSAATGHQNRVALSACGFRVIERKV
jgi:hypothetical protein